MFATDRLSQFDHDLAVRKMLDLTFTQRKSQFRYDLLCQFDA